MLLSSIPSYSSIHETLPATYSFISGCQYRWKENTKKMKRQRGTVSGVSASNLNPSQFEGTSMDVATMVAMQGKKKPKREMEKVKDKVGKSAAEEERKENRDLGLMGTVDNMMGWTCNLEENWPWLQDGLVDEQMSWGSVWYPVWDVDFNAEAFGALYNDVFWDDDIWNLKKKIPNPSER